MVMLHSGSLGVAAIVCKTKSDLSEGGGLEHAGGWRAVWFFIFWQPQKASNGPLSNTLSPDAGNDIATSRGLQMGQTSWPVTVTAAIALCTFRRPQMHAGLARRLLCMGAASELAAGCPGAGKHVSLMGLAAACFWPKATANQANCSFSREYLTYISSLLRAALESRGCRCVWYGRHWRQSLPLLLHPAAQQN